MTDGFLIIDKPAGMTSHDVVFRLRKALGIKRIGHTGTLDPQATGVLIVLVQKACKILQFLEDTDKMYRASVQFGYSTDTMDIYGETIKEKEFDPDFDFDAVLQSFCGTIEQKVPAASAKKVNGKKLIDYKRQDLPVPEVRQNVTIYSIRSVPGPGYTFDVHCSSGTYVRSICEELAHRTGNEGCMKDLRRMAVGRFAIDQAQSLEEAMEHPVIHPMPLLLEHLPWIEVEDPTFVYQGKPFVCDIEHDRIILTNNKIPLAVYDRRQGCEFRSKRGLW